MADVDGSRLEEENQAEKRLDGRYSGLAQHEGRERTLEGPMIFLRPMSELSPYKRKRLCEHEPKCDKFLVINTLNEGMTLCEKDALAFGNNIFQTLNAMPAVKIKGNGFTDAQTKELIDVMRSHARIPHGTYVVLAEKWGKTREQVKSYVWYLRSKGAI